MQNNTLQFQDVDSYELEIEHFNDLKQELVTKIWSGSICLWKGYF